MANSEDLLAYADKLLIHEENLSPNARAVIDLAAALRSAEAALAARQPSEDDREALARVMDTLAYYHCRSVNPKADHPHMGYHAMTEDQREHLREKQREAAEEIMRMIPSLSRAAVPDAVTEAKQPEGWNTEDRQESKQEAERRWSRPVAREAEQRYQAGSINGFMLGAEWQKARETFISYKVIADEARAERDAARAALRGALGYVDKSIDNCVGLPDDLKWDNSEVVEMMRDIRAELARAVDPEVKS